MEQLHINQQNLFADTYVGPQWFVCLFIFAPE